MVRQRIQRVTLYKKMHCVFDRLEYVKISPIHELEGKVADGTIPDIRLGRPDND